jgi:hypothetical protein
VIRKEFLALTVIGATAPHRSIGRLTGLPA